MVRVPRGRNSMSGMLAQLPRPPGRDVMSSSPSFAVRRAVAGADPAGVPTFLSDGRPHRTVGAPNGFGVSELLWLAAPPSAPDDGGDPAPESLGAFPADGAIAARLIRFAAPDPANPP